VAVDVFLDRRDAGRRLAERLEEYKDRNALVLAIPRGGVPVGYEIAQFLQAAFYLLAVPVININGIIYITLAGQHYLDSFARPCPYIPQGAHIVRKSHGYGYGVLIYLQRYDYGLPGDLFGN